MNEDTNVQLFSLMAELTRKFTSGESTSVTYDTANQLMGAILFHIKEYENEKPNMPVSSQNITIKEKYHIGRQLTLQKIEEARTCYNQLIGEFNAYGNENYHDTVTKAIPGFFLYYDDQFHPQDTIITCDYPTIVSPFESEVTGIDLIALYLKYIEIEQRFLKRMPEQFIRQILVRFDPSYSKQFFNVSTIILRHILACMMIGKNVLESESAMDYETFYQKISISNPDALGLELQSLLKKVMEQFYDDSEDMYQYYSADITDFSIQLMSVKQAKYIKNVVIL